jgi:hypothetical protein
MSVIGSNILAGASGNQGKAYNLDRSLRFRSSATAYLNRTPSASNRKTWTYSFWAKLGNIAANKCFMEAGVSGADTYTLIWVESNGAFRITQDEGAGGTLLLASSALHRDPSAWYHFMVSVDTTQATDTNRVKMYVNGVQITSFSTTTYPTQNRDTYINSTFQHRIGNRVRSAGMEYDGYMAETHFIDGQALTPSDFGETSTATGVWIPKKYTGTYGTNGFYLDFEDTSSVAALGYDAAGSNDWTVNNVSLTAGATYDSMTDVPTLTSATAANYATLSPINSTATVSDGNLKSSAGASFIDALATIACDAGAGKWYFEGTLLTLSSTTAWIGVTRSTNSGLNHTAVDSYRTVYQANGTVYRDGTGIGDTATGTTYTTNDVIGVALDSVNGSISFYKNNTLINTTTNALYSTTSFFFYTGQNGSSWAVNFGQRPFAYTPPSGFVALNTFNLPTPTIGAGNKYMNVVTYTGTGSSLSVTGVGFQPDLTWIKGRSGATDHALYDAVRGVQLQLESNTTTDETTETTGLTAFGSDGFTVGALAQLNTSSATYVGWNWKESASSGFDIVTYTGNGSARTISHNLGVAPNMIIVKARTTASTDQGWPVYHSANTAAPETDYLLLNSTAATADLDTVWNDTAPTSSVFSVGTNALVNANNDTYVAYCWSEAAGYSAFGSYTGNGSTDGPFIFTGFRPKFILYKNASSTGSWAMLDTARGTYNVVNPYLLAESSTNEDSSVSLIDILSNGFKMRNTFASGNSNGATYIYMAFAENPFKYANAR